MNGENTETSEVANLRTKERIFLVWSIVATLLLIVIACALGFFYLKNHVFELGVKAGEQASYKRLYSSVKEAGCHTIDINPEDSTQGEKISLINIVCLMKQQSPNSGNMMRNGR